MRSLGASRGAVAALFYVEAAVLAVVAGSLGFFAGSGLAAWLGARIFPGESAGAVLNPVLLPVVVGLALLVAVAGSTPAIRQALKMEPSRGAAGGGLMAVATKRRGVERGLAWGGCCGRVCCIGGRVACRRCWR